jgi:hypothetical protein
MQTRRGSAGTRKAQRRPAARRRRAWAWTVSGLLALGGCAGGHKLTDDPLLGGARARPPASTPLAASAVPPPRPAASGSLTSNAALAAGAPRPLDPSNDLRISDPPRSPDSRYGQGQPTWTGATLQRPEPVANPPMVRATPAPVPTAPPVRGLRLASFEQALDQLKARGVTWYDLKTWGDHGDCKFTCSIPNRQNPYISRNYEAQARSYLEAMQAVLDKIDSEPR